jgi:hypothetical protein
MKIHPGSRGMRQLPWKNFGWRAERTCTSLRTSDVSMRASESANFVMFWGIPVYSQWCSFGPFYQNIFPRGFVLSCHRSAGILTISLKWSKNGFVYWKFPSTSTFAILCRAWSRCLSDVCLRCLFDFFELCRGSRTCPVEDALGPLILSLFFRLSFANLSWSWFDSHGDVVPCDHVLPSHDDRMIDWEPNSSASGSPSPEKWSSILWITKRQLTLYVLLSSNLQADSQPRQGMTPCTSLPV